MESERLSTPSVTQDNRSPRVLRTHLHAYACRIYVTAFRARIGLCVYWPAHPAVPPYIRTPVAKHPVRQASALRTASSRFHPAVATLVVQPTLPLAGSVEDLHLHVSAGRPKKTGSARAPPVCIGRESHRADVSGTTDRHPLLLRTRHGVLGCRRRFCRRLFASARIDLQDPAPLCISATWPFDGV